MVVIKEKEQDVPLSLLKVEEEEKVVVEEENVLFSPFGVEANEKVVVVVMEEEEEKGRAGCAFFPAYGG